VTPERCAENHAGEEFLGRAASRLRERTGADIALAGWVHPRTRQLTIRSVDGVGTDAFVGMTVPPGKGAGGRVVAHGRYVLTEYGDPHAGSGARGPVRDVCTKGARSVLAMPLRLNGQVHYVFYVARFSAKSINAATADSALAFVRQLETFVSQAARTHEIGAPKRWPVDAWVLRQIDDELAELSLELAATPARARIAAIRKLLEENVLKPPSVEEGVLSLTRRELTVLELVAEGLSNAEAAERLVVSPETVKAYLRTIRIKLGVRNRTAAVAVARRSGLLL
jgi:DNA-binding NarL/FixJ family response regulator